MLSDKPILVSCLSTELPGRNSRPQWGSVPQLVSSVCTERGKRTKSMSAMAWHVPELFTLESAHSLHSAVE